MRMSLLQRNQNLKYFVFITININKFNKQYLHGGSIEIMLTALVKDREKKNRYGATSEKRI